MKILSADDQQIILKSIQFRLTDIGFDVVIAKDGQEAIDLFDEHLPDLAILDLEMPLKNGFDVIKHIKRSKNSKIPIIVMSSNDDEETILKAFKMGVNDYIEKPVGINEVVVRVKRLLNLPINFKDIKSDNTIIHKNGIGVVIPFYNEESRLKSEAFARFVKSKYGYVLCFVNDGSADNTLDLLYQYQKNHKEVVKVLNCEKNVGKGEAIRKGMVHLLKDKSLKYIGFLDADFSPNFADFDDLAKTIATQSYKLVAGSRVNTSLNNVSISSSNGLINRPSNYFIKKILGLEMQDTHCGAKIMTRDVVEKTLQTPFYTDYQFNVEIFLRIKNYFGEEKMSKMICEQPMTRWVNEVGNKLSKKSSIQGFGQLFEIARKY